MDKSWKSRLQEYCQKKKIPSPNYRIRQETGTSNKPMFQVSLILILNVLIRDLTFRLKSKLMDVGILGKKIVHRRKRQKVQQPKKHVLILNWILKNKMIHRNIFLQNMLMLKNLQILCQVLSVLEFEKFDHLIDVDYTEQKSLVTIVIAIIFESIIIKIKCIFLWIQFRKFTSRDVMILIVKVFNQQKCRYIRILLVSICILCLYPTTLFYALR